MEQKRLRITTDLDHNITVVQSELKKCTVMELRTNLDIFKDLNYFYRIASRKEEEIEERVFLLIYMKLTF